MKKILSSTLLIATLLVPMYQIFEPSVAHAVTATDPMTVTLTVDPGITISDGANSTLAPNIGITSNGAIGSSSWTVNTNNNLGYTLAVKASAAPALVSGVNNFADFPEAVAGTPNTWAVPASSKAFGYSAFGTDTATATWGTGASCGSTGAPAGTMKYVGFKTTDKTIATSSTVTPTTGTATTICFAAGQNGVYANSGTYTATITATATTL